MKGGEIPGDGDYAFTITYAFTNILLLCTDSNEDELLDLTLLAGIQTVLPSRKLLELEVIAPDCWEKSAVSLDINVPPYPMPNCLSDVNFNAEMTCIAENYALARIDNLIVHDEGATFNEQSGLWEGACVGESEDVLVSFDAIFNIIDTQNPDYPSYLLMFVATDGGDAMNGKCAVEEVLNCENTTNIFSFGNSYVRFDYSH